jgi:outer membrane receptor protein involved in Fe transport
MKKRFTEDGPRPLSTGRNDAQRWLALLSGLGFAVALLATALARAEEPERVAQAGDPEPPPAASDPAEPDPAVKQKSRAKAGIEEIVVLGAESEATEDFETADSVTGFGAEDLAALGAQDIADLASFTPNLEIVTSGATTPTFFIRGVGLNDFNSNSTGSVSIYRDDVMINAPALQLLPLFDVEAVNILRGPQGTGLARNASAGAIKMYSRKPTGEFGGFLRSELGNFDFRDFEGAIEAPIIEDMLAGRFAFRLTGRDGTVKNRCGDAPAFEDRVPVPNFLGPGGLKELGLKNTYTGGSELPDGTPIPGWSVCGEPVENNSVSFIPEGLPSRVNDVDNWAARGTLLFQPTLDMSWLLNAHGSRRDELTRLGQSIGMLGNYCDPNAVVIDPATGEPIPATENCNFPGQQDQCVAPPENVGDPCKAPFDSQCDSFEGAGDGLCTSRIIGVLGGTQGSKSIGYQTREIRARLEELAPCMEGVPGFPNGTCDRPGPQRPENRALRNAAKIQVAKELARNLDSEPRKGDFNICSDTDRLTPGTQCQDGAGKTTNDTWGGYLKGEIVLPLGIQLTTVTGFDSYDRLIDIDLDFSPEILFQIRTEDDGWQVSQDLRLQGLLGDEAGIRWDIGGWFLREQLNVSVTNDLGRASGFAVGARDYTQDLWSAAGYASLSFDFWEDFTLDGGFRYNWEQKKLDYSLVAGGTGITIFEDLDNTWDAPTGTVRLTYRFREDTHVFWKYTRGWKPGTYNATSSVDQGVSVANPETIDAFEAGVRGSWFEGRLGLDFSFFYYSYQDYQLFTAQQFAGGQPEFVILNADDAEVYGAEVDAVVRPWIGAFANVRFGWIESQFTDFVQLQQEIIAQKGALITVNRELQNTGNSLLNSPQFKVSLTGEQMIPLGRWGSFTARYDAVWTDETFYDATEGRGIPNIQNIQFLPEHTVAQPSFWVHHFRLSYRPPGGGFEIAGWVRNFTNETSKTFAFDGSTFNRTSIYFVGEPRTYGGTLTVNF